MRSSRDPSKQVTYAAAQSFIKSCLRRDGSLFEPDRSVWSAPVLDDLWQRFNDSPDESNSSFVEKFRIQLTDAPTATVQLAAEVIYVHFLIAHDIGGATKRNLIHEVASWAAEPITIPTELDAALDWGIASTGVAFKTYRPNQLWFLIDAVHAFKALPTIECKSSWMIRGRSSGSSSRFRRKPRSFNAKRCCTSCSPKCSRTLSRGATRPLSSRRSAVACRSRSPRTPIERSP